ncbi:MAG: hypothetical protein KDA28_16830, partial [Phycisphaerales bacterium]|nr:hypothetical protein [Phycisphaerales bacterium]
VKDWRPFWRRMKPLWFRRGRRMYATKGASTGHPWPLPSETEEAEAYVFIKAHILDRRVEEMDDMVLDWDLLKRLRPSFTSPFSPDAVYEEGEHSLEAGSAVPHASDHDEGGGFAPAHLGGHPIPQRRLTALGTVFVAELNEELADYAGEVATAMEGTATRHTLRTADLALAFGFGRR